eukprot:CAMPEP_0202822176 /NCGR_PEP_ID=MMETSP1389-20130828/10885_1 /ASSEMBLY_ACC=CAM_ASM_000865 /TAXON_ID=302021 /ORGANISM="Rhodomonas sp., Strain CCMP768" /LENGTH=31 /DNA_ID= /DNA_START= /DNA_END= /DNA_ORIENTATION=
MARDHDSETVMAGPPTRQCQSRPAARVTVTK